MYNMVARGWEVIQNLYNLWLHLKKEISIFIIGSN
jgi:hypothetical protein